MARTNGHQTASIDELLDQLQGAIGKTRMKQEVVTATLSDPEFADAKDRELARYLGVSHTYIAKMRAKLREIITAGEAQVSGNVAGNVTGTAIATQPRETRRQWDVAVTQKINRHVKSFSLLHYGESRGLQLRQSMAAAKDMALSKLHEISGQRHSHDFNVSLNACNRSMAWLLTVVSNKATEEWIFEVKLHDDL
jgi:hypothetical protein